MERERGKQGQKRVGISAFNKFFCNGEKNTRPCVFLEEK